MKSITKILLYFFISSVALFGYAFPLNILSSNWYNQSLPHLRNRPLSDITFLDSLLGFAVTGDNTTDDTNYIIKTTNGGDNWNIIYSIYKDLSRVIFINSNTGFVSGGYNGLNGIILKTINSGINWQLINVPDQLRCDDMALLNKDTILIVDKSGFDGVWRSINGGGNWSLIYSGGFSVLPEKIYMYDKNLGFFSTGDIFGFLYRTTNGGYNWTKIGSEVGFSQIKFIDSNIGWKAGNNLMKKSTDGGLNWTVQPLPNPGGNISYGMYSFSIVNKDTIWGCGSVYHFPNTTRAVLYRTTNRGVNWYYQIPDTSIINFYSYRFIYFFNKKIGWAYSISKGIHTINGGDTTFLSGIQKINTKTPTNFLLYQNYPNPFNPKTIIKYQLKTSGIVKLKVFDLIGKEIITLIDQKQSSGEYQIDYSCKDCSTGVYFYKIEIQSEKDYFTDTKKMLLVK